MRLFAHYRAPDLTDAEADWVMEDLIDDLAEFPAVVIAAACREWRRTQKWRPTIAELREACEWQRQSLARQVVRAELIGAAKRVGWRAVATIAAENYYTNGQAAGLLRRAWHVDPERVECIRQLADRLPPSPNYDDPALVAFRSALDDLPRLQ
jgi:hypothetical protein